jgi:hypothetical protein
VGLSASPPIAMSLKQPQVGGGAALGAWEIHDGEPKVGDRAGCFRRWGTGLALVCCGKMIADYCCLGLEAGL